MATNSIHSLPHRHRHRHSSPNYHLNPPPSTAGFLKPVTATLKTSLSSSSTTVTTYSLSPTSPSSSSSTTTAAAAAAAAASTSEPATALDALRNHLSSKDYRQADEETRRLLIVLAGEAAVKRGYVFFSEVQFISESDLKAIDCLWREHSGGKFGYSVQKKIWEKANKDFTTFFIKVGWMKKLDTEVEQYNYRAFPTEFTWELTDETPEGHLPLTNALRGTRLLNSILNHPAFKDTDEVVAEEEEDSDNSSKSRDSGSKPLSNRLFKPNYSF
ncbi:tetrapyrrole-binding protein, chloroplastic [Punica granatum]|uniref:GUN4-like domain-containing protein n=2 Tax=Punica granatum TaxID=22663 RepID=A0A218W3J4_PUNGR|nr:tetrapyrrole-binding protein, chloroplastic [Punica granatum]OWM67434.1 hypothetical protein CDL15_Pgr019894 [Punica granatum]PKI74213.1 hypothetical protein CRG98_005451 [Punica granatum]